MKARQQDGPLASRDAWWKAIFFVGGCLLPGFLSSYLGGAFTKQAWYDDSPKPRIWPPQWIFPVVWIGNYTLMSLALWQVWRTRRQQAITTSLTIFGLHFLHNILFIPIVYHFKRKSVYVFMDTIGLASGLLTTSMFAGVSRAAGWLMLPYLCWLFFTTFIKVLWWRLDGTPAHASSPTADETIPKPVL